MPKDEKEMPVRPEPQQLPMPKYDYQKPEGGSISAPYRGEPKRECAPANALQSVHFA